MDEARLHEFMGKLVGDMGAAATLANVILGDELGLYRAMADSQPVTPKTLAERTGCHPRLVREWLSAQAAAGYMEHHDGTFRLPEEQAMALALEDSPAYMAGGAAVVAALFHDKDKLVAAMRGDGGLAWGDHHPCMFSGTERFFRPGYRTFLVAEWLPALDGVVAKLQAGAKVADVGCGHGASTLVMAEAFAASRFFGYDYHAPSIATARERANDAGVAERVRFEQASAKDYPGHDHDLVCFFDCLHDMGDPVGAARHAHRALKDDGTVMLVEPYAEDALDGNLNPVGRLFYAASTFICTPNSLSQEVGLGLGAQAGEARLRAVFEEAGFTRFRRATQTPFNLILEARK
ncbi:class I SAM-dependent methyltransferase [Pseudomonas entomophila]|uniref:class I SAM-dependent methyltransferase n=1 Tax=Pseudomonas entomophila TaxID=312306 RepID=UPI0023D83784|nr:class I SAM-dependent methyltransferase [Pseudomonas entomophila]MDF0732082.1 class I SAM-dependent methyltransferase [Pseudomonas entomophila]